MIIRNVNLVNFRSHEKFGLEFTDKTTSIVGENGCGKTSILEAVYEAMQGKSFRAVDGEVIRRGADYYRVEIEYIDGRRVVVLYDGLKKEFLAEDKKMRRLNKKNKYPVVLFLPEDLHLVSTGPVNRRNYFDRVFAGLDEKYGAALSKYNKALKQRNTLLKQGDVRREDLFPWDVMLAKYGAEIMDIRKRMILEINQQITDTYRTIAENGDVVKIEYNTRVESESGVINILEKELERDIIMGHTGYGVHRDNFDFYFNDVEADGSASRGEVRSIILALKFIEANEAKNKLGKKPLVLLDDVFSELDETRQKCLVRNFQENQIILTSVGAGKLQVV